MTVTKGKVVVLALRLASYLPLPVLQLLGRMLGYCGWYFHSKARRITEINLHYCLPQLDRRARKTLARKSLLNAVICTLEMAALWHKPKSWITTKIIGIKGLSLFEDYLKKEAGLLLLAPHIGNWEILNVQLSEYSQILSLYKPHPLVELDKLMLNARTRLGGDFAPTERNSVKLLLNQLKKGQTACILPDQVPIDDNSAISAPFFGHQAKTMTLIYRLIQKTRCNVLFVYCERVSGGFVTVFKEADQAIYNSDKLISVTALNNSIEQCVLDVPEQYQWGYKRFKEEQVFYKK
jgi:Kdo2-lipid IVA lauroyltransferase/acyltransferase